MNDLPRIRSCMKRNVIFARADTTVGEAVSLMVEKKVGTLPVVGEGACTSTIWPTCR